MVMNQKPIGKKVGRNEPCPCDSGRKYKKCCWLKGIEIRSLPKEAYKDEEEKIERRKKLTIAITGIEVGYYLPHIQTIHQGKRFRSVYSRIFYRKPEETFHEFIIFVFKMTMGQDWADAEEAKPDGERHFIAECYLKYLDCLRENKDDEEFKRTGRYSAIPDGYTQWLLCLAFDLYCLQHTKQLPQNLLDRLKSDGDQFQGARYEIAIASVFARAGFKIEFFDEKDPSVVKNKHCEFIATDPDSGVKIAVEAKSKHRPGILHDQRDIADEDKKYLKGDIHRLLRDAMEKEVGNLPYMVFVDLNARHTPDLDVEDKPWLKDIYRVVGQNTDGVNAGKANLIGVTNFSYHYQGDDKASGSETLYSIAMKPDFPLPEELMNKIMHVFNKYASVPDLDMIYDQMKFSD